MDKDNKNFTVYYHLNKTNGKVYFGITSKDVRARWCAGSGYRKCTGFERAIKKYGWDGFHHRILIDGLTKEVAELIEQNLIKWSNSQNKKHGYNIKAGGNTCSFSEESIERMRIAHTGHVHSAEQCKNISISKIGKPRTMATKEKMSAAMSGKKVADRKRPNAGRRRGAETRRIKCIEADVIFNTMAEASEWAEVSRSAIWRVLNGKCKTINGYHWQYESPELNERLRNTKWNS